MFSFKKPQVLNCKCRVVRLTTIGAGILPCLLFRFQGALKTHGQGPTTVAAGKQCAILQVKETQELTVPFNQSKRKTSCATDQTNPDHQHKAPDDSHEATQPMVDLPTHKLRLDAGPTFPLMLCFVWSVVWCGGLLARPLEGPLVQVKNELGKVEVMPDSDPLVLLSHRSGDCKCKTMTLKPSNERGVAFLFA